DETTLQDLFAAARVDPAGAKVRFSGSVTTRARCARCGLEHTQVHWARDLTEAVGACACGGPPPPRPLWARPPLPATPRRPSPATALRAWQGQPLSAWGVPPRAVIAVEAGDEQHAFVIGAGRRA